MRTFIFLFCSTVFSFTSGEIFSQNVKVQIDSDKTITIDEVFSIIKQQTDYNFIYKSDMFKDYPKINVKKGIIRANKLLEKSLSNGDFKVNISTDNTIIISQNIYLENAQEIDITGQVVDANGMPLPGVTVYVTNRKPDGKSINKDFLIRGTATDINGDFSIKAEVGYYLVATGLGYDFYTELISENKTVFNIILKEKFSALEEVMVVGYGTTKKKDLTGSVGSVKASEIEQIKTQTIDQALVGKIPGVYVSALSGAPGAGAIVHIRGLSALRGDNQPLYVVDGVPITINPIFDSTGLGTFGERENPLLAINPNDVERVDVLKDASAAAIYGSRAANGVIIITTKRGKRNQKPRFNFSWNSTFQNPTNTWDVLNVDQYKAFTTESAQARIDAGSGTARDTEIVNGTFFGNADTDWQDEITNNNALWNNYRFNVTGGTDNVNYLVSANVTDQEGIMLGSKLKRYNFSTNIDADVTEYLKLGASINYNHSVNKSSAVQGLLQGFFRPDLGVFEDNGEYTTEPAPFGPNPRVRNPVGGNALVKNKTISQNLFGSVYGEINIIKGLKFKSMLSVATNNDKTTNFNPSFSFGASTNPNDGSPEANLNLQSNVGYSTSFSNTLSYNADFDGGHRIDAVAGVSWDQSKLDLEAQGYAGFPDDFILTDIGSSNRTTSPESESVESALNSLFGRVNYNYKDRYLATVTARRDGSTKFGSNNQYGFFPSGALAWNMHNEDFFNSNLISQLKLRASLGRVGSDNLASFSYLAYLSSLSNGASIYAGVNGIAINGLPNADIKWEETDQLDLGLEFGMFNNRLNGEIVYFEKNTNGIILFTPLPSETGFQSYNSNVADVSNKGWEITIGGDVLRSENFNWNSSFNISFVKNNVDNLYDGTVLGTGNVSSIQEGQPIGVINGYDVVSIAQNQGEIDVLNAAAPDGNYYSSLNQPGDYIFRDINGDGEITIDDRTPLGDINPDYFGGWNNTMTYKNWDFSFNFQFVQGNEKEVSVAQFLQNADPETNTTTIIYDAWSPENPNAKYGRLGMTGEAAAVSKYVGDGSYIRLRSTALGFNFPSDWLGKTGITNAKLSLTANNLFTITNYIGLDPESVSQPRGGTTVDLARDEAYAYPLAKTFTIGLNVTF
ncbi:SusC/RagA family TonB-linked outer membrane protein [Flaviramulus basaltis]|nr:TonB-dependent receptor [Flaviramulus basaltis]